MKDGIIFLVLILVLFGVIANADKITSPPPFPKESTALKLYMQDVYDNLHVLQVVTSNPDGSRNGRKGEMVLLQTGGNTYLEINSDSSTTWLGVQLTDTP